jgi:hypothetical protein
MDKDTVGIVFFTLFEVAVTILVWTVSRANAHGVISTECQKLGAFYVGEKVFECKLKEKSNG